MKRIVDKVVSAGGELIGEIEGDVKSSFLGIESSGDSLHLGHLTWVWIGRQLIEIGVDFRVLLATLHAKLNSKMKDFEQVVLNLETQLSNLRINSLRYEEIQVEAFLRSIEMGIVTPISRLRRTMSALGRSEDEYMNSPTSYITYVLLQAADPYVLGVDLIICGNDQRNIYVYMREVAKKLGLRPLPILCLPIIESLRGGNKMSKSDPNSTIYLEDSVDIVAKKIKMAFCPIDRDSGLLKTVNILSHLGILDVKIPEDLDNLNFREFKGLISVEISRFLKAIQQR